MQNPLTRRDVLALGASATAASLLSACASGGAAPPATAAPVAKPAPKPGRAETLAAELHASLSADQRSKLVRGWDDPLRTGVDNNWMALPLTLGAALTPAQVALARDWFRSLHSEARADAVLAQVEEDNSGFDACNLAFFHDPQAERLTTLFTGRHVTRRTDGNLADRVPFGGPIFYGHAHGSFNEKADHPGNAYWFQGQSANRLFQALDGKQRGRGLQVQCPAERGRKTVEQPEAVAGLAAADLSADQQALLRTTLQDLMAPFRAEDAAETMAALEAHGGMQALTLAWYKKPEIGDDGVWDSWSVRGPGCVWIFRGAPHVHCWVSLKGA